jgi:hypothetical protein
MGDVDLYRVKELMGPSSIYSGPQSQNHFLKKIRWKGNDEKGEGR